MVERQPTLTFLSHAALWLGILALALPVWIAFVSSTHSLDRLSQSPIPLLPGDQFWENYRGVLTEGVGAEKRVPVRRMLANSLIMALVIPVGKIVISITSAFAIVYFRFPFRTTCFWIIFSTLMLPVEVRIVPTFKVVAQLELLNSYAGLTIPLVASATATFLFRQFFLSVPRELAEAAQIDGAGPLRFFVSILLPLSRTNIAALFVILFIFGWNQYLWPLLITTEESYSTIVMSIQRMTTVADANVQWHLVMATAMLAIIPPTCVILILQRLFVKGLIEVEK